MMAMTMPYKVQSNGIISNVSAGDLITAQLQVKDDVGTITSITKTGTAPPDVPNPSPLSDGIVMILRGGQGVPTPPLVDQDGKARHLADIRDGHAMAVTF